MFTSNRLNWIKTNGDVKHILLITNIKTPFI